MQFYKDLLTNIGLKNVYGCGTYSMPMISHSVEFPFTLLSEQSELVVVEKLKSHLESLKTRNDSKSDPWLCNEEYGHAILIWGTKPIS